MIPLTDSDAAALATLTPREREALTIAAKGFRIEEIASLMGCKRFTALDHLQRVYRKLDVSTRVEAAVIAAKAGWV